MALVSMTGSGHGTHGGQGSGGAVRVEIRSVNGRGLEVKVRGAGPHEDAVASTVRTHARRGSVHVVVTSDSGPIGINRAALAAWQARLADVGPVSLEWLLARPGVMDGDTLDGADVLAAVTEAVATWRAARLREGAALGADMMTRASSLLAQLPRARELAKAVPGELAGTLAARLAELRSEDGRGVSDDRLAQEVAILADRADVTEELTRLDVHLREVARVLTVGGEVGRRLDFLLQEIMRELTTSSAKSRSVPLTQWLIDAKLEAEKLREQAQNLE